MPPLEVYATAFCPFCHKAKALLKKKGGAFEEHDGTFQPKKRAAMTARADGRTSVPQIFIDDVGIGGCDELHALDAKGELDAKLGLA